MTIWSGIDTQKNLGPDTVKQVCFGLGEACQAYKNGVWDQLRTNILLAGTIGVAAATSGRRPLLATQWPESRAWKAPTRGGGESDCGRAGFPGLGQAALRGRFDPSGYHTGSRGKRAGGVSPDQAGKVAIESEVQKPDRFELVAELATGGMATVYLARVSGAGGFQRFVAIKRLHPHLAREEEFIEMFLDEARLAARIHHPNVVSILEIGASEQSYYIVMGSTWRATPSHTFFRTARSAGSACR